MLAILRNPRYWDKKMRIAFLVLVTFLAMC